jgi:universal stress protein A
MSNYSHVLVAVDFSEFSERAAVRAAEIADLDRASLTLLHVIDYFPEDLPVDLIAPEDVDPAEYLENECRVKLTDLAGRVGYAAAMPLVTFSTHSARHEIVPISEQQGADLVVIASHGRRGIADYVGSTAHAVIHGARCDVLVIRAGA